MKKHKKQKKYYEKRVKKALQAEVHKWQHMQLCVPKTEEEIKFLLEEERKALRAQGSYRAEDWTDEKIDSYVQDMLSCWYYRNNKYQVAKYPPRQYAPNWPEVIHLSIKRLDKAPVHNWSDLQRIKNEVVGNEYEAIEIYPAESRMVNMANQYHLWVIAKEGVSIPVGFFEGRRTDAQVAGSKSRQTFEDTRVS